MYVASVSVARDQDASYVAWGHSTIVSPWFVIYIGKQIVKYVAYHCFFPRNDRGEVVQKMSDEEGIIYADIGKYEPCHVIVYLHCCVTQIWTR